MWIGCHVINCTPGIFLVSPSQQVAAKFPLISLGMTDKLEENIFEAAIRKSTKAALQMQHQMESLSGSTKYSECVKFTSHLVHNQLISVHARPTDLVHHNEPVELLRRVGKAYEYDFLAEVNFDELRSLHTTEMREKYDHTVSLEHPPREEPEERETHLSDHKDRVHARASNHKESVNLEQRRGCVEKLLAVDKKGVVQTNFPKLIDSCCAMAAASYNVRRRGDEGPNAEHVANEATKVRLLSAFAFGFSEDEGIVQVHHLRSEVGCGVFAFSPRRNSIIISFRGTKEPIDLQTDLTSIPQSFTPHEPSDLEMEVLNVLKISEF